MREVPRDTAEVAGGVPVAAEAEVACRGVPGGSYLEVVMSLTDADILLPRPVGKLECPLCGKTVRLWVLSSAGGKQVAEYHHEKRVCKTTIRHG